MLAGQFYTGQPGIASGSIIPLLMHCCAVYLFTYDWAMCVSTVIPSTALWFLM